jgi:hypothetical protein
MDRHIVIGISAAVTLAFAPFALAQTQAPPDRDPGSTSTTQPSQGTSPTETTPSAGANPSNASSEHQQGVTGKEDTYSTSPSSGANPSNASSPHQRSATGKEESDTGAGSSRMHTAAAGSVTAGMGVQSTGGDSIGTVTDVVPSATSGSPAYIMIVTTSGNTTAVPYATVAPMVRNDKIVMDRARLEGAPKVDVSQVQDRSDTQWQKQVNQYWKASGMHSTSPSGKDTG